MISALSQSQKQQATVHAGKQKNVQQVPTAQQQAATSPTDDPKTLPPTPDNNQTPQQQIIVVKQKSLLEKTLPWVAAGVVSLAGAVFGLRHLGQKFHETKVEPWIKGLAKPEGSYRTEFLDPMFKIAQALDEHEKNDSNAKATLDSLRGQLSITKKGDNYRIGTYHGIPFDEETKNVMHAFAINHEEVKTLAAKLPDNIRTLCSQLESNMKAFEGDSNRNSNVPANLTIPIIFELNKEKATVEPIHAEHFSTINMGWQVATNEVTSTVKGWFTDSENFFKLKIKNKPDEGKDPQQINID